MASNKVLPTSVSLPIPPEKLSQTVDDAKDFACLNGFLMRTIEEPGSSDVVRPAPFMLLPTAIPKTLFQKAVDIQPYINELYFKVANDYDFLRKTLERTIAVDEFTAKQWEILETARKQGKTKSIQLAMIRSDYMMDTARADSLVLSQVEVNTISVAPAGLSSRLEKIHKFVIGQLANDSEKAKVPYNCACYCYAEALYCAWKMYGNPQAVLVMFIEEAPANVFDQRLVEQAIVNRDPTIKVRRRTMSYVGEHGSLTEDSRFLLEGEEVAVFYYRTGYIPDQFKTHFDWKAKLNAELSTAVVCPSIGWHLAGSKKVQQELTRPGVLEKFISDPEKVAAIRSTFTGLYSLELDTEGDEMASRAIANPENYVMKPQLEGGGNNIFGDDIKTALQKMAGTEERGKYILMDRIKPYSAKNFSIKRGLSFDTPGDYVSEFGFFGFLLSSSNLNKIVLNKASGHQVRTKLRSQNEGGLLVGIASLDSPFLVD
ncbi:Glutathione synthetase [Holothuria leucospilota]|uniref:Glutathione synthetase n=1 Tax=Holothuria leucospilota TaxID=206669 RepID=A0A9Q1CFX7_HOLLE|nr:Glutathione synthetase [Holothuria leucospilota]